MDAVASAWSTTFGRLRPQWEPLRRFAPYLIALALPGSIVWLPLLVIWQHRQRSRMLSR